jgi:hypothetical protein
MAHFAQLDESNIVTQVIVVNNNELLDDGVESEAKGIAFCQSLFGGNWVQTSYNSSIRKNYAGIGYTWDGTGFAPPKPYDSWTLDTETYLWNASTPMPIEEGKSFEWDEPTLSWVEIELPA